jgi:hypothetical protein
MTQQQIHGIQQLIQMPPLEMNDLVVTDVTILIVTEKFISSVEE